MGKYHNKYDSKKQNRLDISRILALLPIFLTVGLMPILVRLHVYNPQLDEFAWYYISSDGVFADVFLYFRQWWFTWISAYMFLVILCRAIFDRNKLQYSLACIPLGVFALFAFLSACFSKYPHFAFHGSFEQFENVFVLMGYAVIVYYSLIVIRSEQEVKYIIYILTGSTLLLSLVGAGQTLGFDLLGTDFVKSLIVPRGLDADLSSTVSNTTAYMTLYNPNYVGVYVATLFPLFIVLSIYSKSVWERVAYIVTSVLLLFTLYGSGSKAAFLVIAVETLIFLLFLRKTLLKQWYLIIPAATAIVCIFLLLNQWYDNIYIDRIKASLQIQETSYDLESIDTLDDVIAIKHKDDTLYLSYYLSDSETVVINAYDDQNSDLYLTYNEERNAYVINKETYADMEISLVQYDQYLCICITLGGNEWIFTNQYGDDGTYYYLTTKGKFDKLTTAEQVIFGNYERLFSGRGYIWSVTIPLLKEHIFLGSGADTFAATFPQQDYVRLWRNGFSEQVMSKPHSLYLQIGVQNGVIALLGIIAFFAIYLFDCFRLYIKADFKSFYEQVGVAIMLSVVGFAITGISNDSSVTVSPIFWAIAGLGIYINAQVKKARETAK